VARLGPPKVPRSGCYRGEADLQQSASNLRRRFTPRQGEAELTRGSTPAAVLRPWFAPVLISSAVTIPTRYLTVASVQSCHTNWLTRRPAGAEAFAGRDASKAATEMATALRHQGSLLRKIVNRLSSSAMAKVTVSQVSRALMRPEPSLICRSWATTWATRLRMSRSSPTMTSPGKRRAKAHGQPGNRPWGSTRFEFDNRAPSAPNAGSASHAYPMVCVRGRFGVSAPGRSHHTLSV